MSDDIEQAAKDYVATGNVKPIQALILRLARVAKERREAERIWLGLPPEGDDGQAG